MSDLSITLPKVLALSLFQRFMPHRKDLEEGTIDICCALCILYMRERDGDFACAHCPMNKFDSLDASIFLDSCAKWTKAVEPSLSTHFKMLSGIMRRRTPEEKAAKVLASFATKATALVTWVDENGVKVDSRDVYAAHLFAHKDHVHHKPLVKKLLAVKTCVDMEQKPPEIGYQWDAGTIISPHLSGRFFAELTERGWGVYFYVFKPHKRVDSEKFDNEIVDTFCFAHFDATNELAERQAKLYARELTDFANTLASEEQTEKGE